jgi:chromosome segregation ATPase
MSLKQKMEQFEASNKEMTEKVAELETAVAEKDGAIEKMAEEHGVIVAELEAKVAELEEGAVQATAKLEAVEAEKVEAIEKVEAAEEKLAHPAMADASAEGEDEAADATVVVEEAAVEERDYMAEFAALEDGIERSKWLDENAEALQAQYNAIDKSDVEEK